MARLRVCILVLAALCAVTASDSDTPAEALADYDIDGTLSQAPTSSTVQVVSASPCTGVTCTSNPCTGTQCTVTNGGASTVVQAAPAAQTVIQAPAAAPAVVQAAPTASYVLVPANNNNNNNNQASSSKLSLREQREIKKEIRRKVDRATALIKKDLAAVLTKRVDRNIRGAARRAVKRSSGLLFRRVRRLKRNVRTAVSKLGRARSQISRAAKRLSKIRRGMRGPPGRPGRRGARGPRGRTGQRGHRGRRGRRGPGGRGPRGPPGKPGKPGHNGHRGPRGKPGHNGHRGRRGPRGKTGHRGRNGHNGHRGRPGRPGRNGHSGSRGPRGPRGKNGKNGKNGRGGGRPRFQACFGPNEAKCAKRRTRFMTCSAVGDPHYRTFDGVRFDYQKTGEFILARHQLDPAGKNVDFEVQNKQRVCPNPRVRCNMGVAVRAGRHTVVAYVDWGTGRVLIDGKSTRLRHGGRRRIAKDFEITSHRSHIIVRYRNTNVKAFYRPWGRTHYMDLFVQATWRWSSGRSMRGLCANYNANPRDDWRSIKPATQWHVTGGRKSLFRHPRAMVQADGTTTLSAYQSPFDEKSHPYLAASSKWMLAEASNAHVSSHAHRHTPIPWSTITAARKAHILEKCRHLVGAMKYDCEYDMVLGEPSEATLATGLLGQILNREKILAMCIHLKADHSADKTFANSRLPASDEFTYTFWYRSDADASAAPHNILKKGSGLSIDIVNHKIKATVGATSCTASSALEKGKAQEISVIVTKVHGHYKLRVYLGTDKKCEASLPAAPAANSADVHVAGAGATPAVGAVGRLYYVPLPTDESASGLNRYAHRAAPACFKGSG